MEGILNKYNLIKNYKILKINNLEITEPKYEVKYNKIYIDDVSEQPEWTYIHKILINNDYIIDKNIVNKIFRLSKDNREKYSNYEFTQNTKLKINIDKLIIGNFDTNNLISNKDLILNITEDEVNYNNLNLITKYNYDIISIYHINPIGFSLGDNRIEQKRLKINIDKLKTLKYLKNGGEYFYLITHLTIEASKDIIVILSYLFEECYVKRPILNNFVSTAIYIYCNNFDKKKFNKISNKLSLNRFESLGNIDNISELGIKSDQKNDIIRDINYVSKIITRIITDSLKIKKDTDIHLVANIAFNLNIPIFPNFIDKKYEPYMDLYNICSTNNLINIKTESTHNFKLINEILQIYLKNQRFGNIDTEYTEYNEYINYDLIIIDKIENLDKIINKLAINKYLYFNTSYNSSQILNLVKNKTLELVSKNIYKKIGYISTLYDVKFKYNNFDIDIYDTKKYRFDIIQKLIPFIKLNNKYTHYSISLKNKEMEIKEDNYNIYPFYPIYDKLNEKIYLNPIHSQLIDTTNKINIFNTIKENIKILLTSDSNGLIKSKLNRSNQLKFNNLNNQKRLITEDIIHIKVNHEPVPYYESNHGIFSDGTKSNLYTILKLFKLNTIFEFGTWYGNSSEYIKEHNPNCKLICVDYFHSIIESGFTIRGVGIDKFFIKYPRLESVYKKMQKYKDVELIKGDCLTGYYYLLKNYSKPDMIFIDFLKESNILFIFISKISMDYVNTIIIGNDFASKGVKLAINEFMDKNQDKYVLIKNENSYILIPIHLYKKEIEIVMNKINNEYIKKEKQNLYFSCVNEIKNGNFKRAINMVLDNNLDLNLINKYIPNKGTLYHIFGFYLREHEKKDSYLSILYDIEKPKDILNDFEFTFKDILRYDPYRLNRLDN